MFGITLIPDTDKRTRTLFSKGSQILIWDEVGNEDLIRNIYFFNFLHLIKNRGLSVLIYLVIYAH